MLTVTFLSHVFVHVLPLVHLVESFALMVVAFVTVIPLFPEEVKANAVKPTMTSPAIKFFIILSFKLIELIVKITHR